MMLSQKYIDHNNQTILWNTIKNIDLVNEIFGGSLNAENMKVSWFKSIIESMYESIPKTAAYIPVLLNEKNKETISFMVENLKTMKNTKMNKNTQAIQTPIQNQIIGKHAPTSIYSRNGSNRSDAFLANFSERQKEYDNMIKKPAPPNEDVFENKIEDTAISNMDELIKQHMKQREDELSMYAIPVPPGTAIQSDATRIQESFVKSPDVGEKKITWANDVLQAITELKTEMAEIKALLVEMKNAPKII
jgi:hypothetical protein